MVINAKCLGKNFHYELKDRLEQMYGEAINTQTVRYSQIQNLLASRFKRPREEGFLYKCI